MLPKLFFFTWIHVKSREKQWKSVIFPEFFWSKCEKVWIFKLLCFLFALLEINQKLGRFSHIITLLGRKSVQKRKPHFSQIIPDFHVNPRYFTLNHVKKVWIHKNSQKIAWFHVKKSQFWQHCMFNLYIRNYTQKLCIVSITHWIIIYQLNGMANSNLYGKIYPQNLKHP